jgi:predicted RNase H-like nuclease (RuvC/YqgF family)
MSDKDTIKELKAEIRQLQSKVRFNKKPNKDEDKILDRAYEIRERLKQRIDSGVELDQKDNDIKTLLNIIRNKIALPKGKIHEEAEV